MSDRGGSVNSVSSLKERNAPTVTWLMPAFNAEKTIRESLESILLQTFSDFEVVIVNDGSTDTTPFILDEIQGRDSRVRVIHQENGGVVAARNKGLIEARGEWIACLDADDRAVPDRLEKQMLAISATISSRKIVAIGSDIQLIDALGVLLKVRHYPYQARDVRTQMCWSNPIANPAVLFHRKTALDLGGYDEGFEGAEDYLLWMKMLHSGDIINVPEPLTHYRIHSGQFKSTRTRLQLWQTIRARWIGIPKEYRGLRFYLRTLLELGLYLLPSRVIVFLFRMMV